MSNSLQVFSFVVEIYKSRVYVLTGRAEEASVWIKQRTDIVVNPDFAGMSGWFVNSNGGRSFYLWLETYDDSAVFLSNLAHETIHTMLGITDYVGLVLTGESEEAFAYLAEQIYRRALTGLRKSNHA